MIRKVEEAIGVFDGVTAPYDGIDVEVSWIDGKSVVAFGGVSITLPPSLIVVEWADLAEANEILDRMQSLSGVTKMLKAIVSEAYPPDIFSAEYPAPDLGTLVASVAHRFCDEHKLRIETQLKNWELRKEIARMKGEQWAQPRQEQYPT
jgi:urease gamma subunit